MAKERWSIRAEFKVEELKESEKGDWNEVWEAEEERFNMIQGRLISRVDKKTIVIKTAIAGILVETAGITIDLKDIKLRLVLDDQE